MHHLLSGREEGDAHPARDDLGDRGAERAGVFGQGPTVDRQPCDKAPRSLSPSINSGIGLPYSCTAIRRPATGKWESSVASVSCQVLGSGT